MKIPCGGFYVDEETLSVEDNILKVKSSGSSDLPEVTDADDGKILKVIDGKWQASDELERVCVADEQDVIASLHVTDVLLSVSPNENLSEISEGDTIELIIDDKSYVGTVEQGIDYLEVFFENEFDRFLRMSIPELDSDDFNVVSNYYFVEGESYSVKINLLKEKSQDDGGVTVVEINLDQVEGDLTITNGTALCDMFDVIYNDPKKVFSYGLVVHIQDLGVVTCVPMTTTSPMGTSVYFYSFTPSGLTNEFWVGDGEYSYGNGDNPFGFEDVSFTRNDITEDDVIIIPVIG